LEADVRRKSKQVTKENKRNLISFSKLGRKNGSRSFVKFWAFLEAHGFSCSDAWLDQIQEHQLRNGTYVGAIFETMSWAFGGPMLGHLMALLSLCSVYFEQKNATIWVYFQLI
jgi:hypothetical protein